MRTLKICVSVLLLLSCVLSRASAQEKEEQAERVRHWAHVVAVQATADIASVQSFSIAIDRFSRAVDGKTETPDTAFVMAVFREDEEKFSVNWWYSRKHQGWFELDAEGVPTLHLRPRSDDQSKMPAERVLAFRKLADPPADSGGKFHVWILKEADPFCSQPQRHQAYSQVDWWKVFLNPDQERYKFVLADPAQLEGPIAVPKWEPSEADRLWGGIRLGTDADSESSGPTAPSTDEGGK